MIRRVSLRSADCASFGREKIQPVGSATLESLEQQRLQHTRSNMSDGLNRWNTNGLLAYRLPGPIPEGEQCSRVGPGATFNCDLFVYVAFRLKAWSRQRVDPAIRPAMPNVVIGV